MSLEMRESTTSKRERPVVSAEPRRGQASAEALWKRPCKAAYHPTEEDATWQLQVSAECLGRLQRALYERGTSPALTALVTFGLRTNPHQEAGALLGAVREKLNTHDELWFELRRYREALEPNAHCHHQHETGMYDARGSHAEAKAKPQMEHVREFMAFVVTRLQVTRGTHAVWCALFSSNIEAKLPAR